MYAATNDNIYQVKKVRGHKAYKIYRLILDGRKTYVTSNLAETPEASLNQWLIEGTWKKIDLRTIIKIKAGEK